MLCESRTIYCKIQQGVLCTKQCCCSTPGITVPSARHISLTFMRRRPALLWKHPDTTSTVTKVVINANRVNHGIERNSMVVLNTRAGAHTPFV